MIETETRHDTIEGQKRWFALVVLCMGSLMIVLDTTIVNVALPSIRADLGFSETSLAWVVNAYLLTFGGFLLLGGRLGDLYGHRRMFLIGIALFTAASIACGGLSKFGSPVVSVITGLPAARALLTIFFCRPGTCSTGSSTPRSPRATIRPSE